jgi:hypothetical protein
MPYYRHPSKNSGKKMPLTSAIYAPDGTINWADASVRDTVFNHGAETVALENYAFLYDVYKLRIVVNSSSIQDDKKVIAARAIAQQIFKKTILKSSENGLRGSLYVAGKKLDIFSEINISGSLYLKLKGLIENIEQKKSAEIMELFESAISEITPSLNLPRRRSLRTRLAQFSGVEHTSHSGRSSSRQPDTFMLYTPVSTNRSAEDDRINWARSISQNNGDLLNSPLSSAPTSTSTSPRNNNNRNTKN